MVGAFDISWRKELSKPQGVTYRTYLTTNCRNATKPKKIVRITPIVDIVNEILFLLDWVLRLPSRISISSASWLRLLRARSKLLVSIACCNIFSRFASLLESEENGCKLFMRFKVFTMRDRISRGGFIRYTDLNCSSSEVSIEQIRSSIISGVDRKYSLKPEYRSDNLLYSICIWGTHSLSSWQFSKTDTTPRKNRLLANLLFRCFRTKRIKGM